MFSWLGRKWPRLAAAPGRNGNGNGKGNGRRGDARSAATPQVPDLRRALPQIAVEFERARRYERSVTVAVFTVARDESGSVLTLGVNPVNPPTGDDHATPHDEHLCPVVREAVRELDLVVCDPAARRCVVVMPEIGAEEGERAVSRMRDLCAARLQCPVRGDLAVFPRDGWMFNDLVEAAQKASTVSVGTREWIARTT